jgi:N-methylhydantoinase A
MPQKNVLVIGVDTGGTFTDFVYIESGKVGVYKTLSTPDNPAEAVIGGLGEFAGGAVKQIVHGSTVATNAVLERKGVRIALITNRGFEDIIEIGRQAREKLYELRYVKSPPLVSEKLRFGIRGRLLYTGIVKEEINLEEIESLVDVIANSGAESVAVSLLFSYANPSHEREVEKICSDRGLSVSASHRILPEFREYERTSTTVLNAYVSPIMKKYLVHLADNLDEGDQLRVMQSNGGSISSSTAMTESIRTVLSGPAGGVVGAFEIGKMAGYDSLITFDMGGTSTDVSLIDGDVSLTTESRISGWPIKVPMIDIHTVGAGGGSIARVDAGGSLRVGPESAGANPGPICYGKGDRVTVTDANLYLGRLVAEHFLGGRMRLETENLEGFFEELSKEAGLKPVELAEGICEVANATMEKAIRVISVERGYNPQEFTLLSFGGAGGLHAVFLADLLSIPRVLVPENPGLLSAYGMLLADILKDYSLTVMLGGEGTSSREIGDLFLPIEKRGRNELVEEGLGRDTIALERYLDMRYRGQSHEIVIPFTDDYIGSFHEHHERLFGYKNPGREVEIVNIRLRARGVPEKPEVVPLPDAGPELVTGATLGEREVVFRSRAVRSRVVLREKLLPGNLIRSPAVVVEYSATTVIPPGWLARVDGYRNLVIEREV